MPRQRKSSGKKKTGFFYRNSLTIVFLILFMITIGGQGYTGWKEHNEHIGQKGSPPISFTRYLNTGHFIQATFENWESEFLQMALFVVLSIFLRQKGSSESKPLDGDDEVDREPKPSKDAP